MVSGISISQLSPIGACAVRLHAVVSAGWQWRVLAGCGVSFVGWARVCDCKVCLAQIEFILRLGGVVGVCGSVLRGVRVRAVVWCGCGCVLPSLNGMLVGINDRRAMSLYADSISEWYSLATVGDPLRSVAFLAFICTATSTLTERSASARFSETLISYPFNRRGSRCCSTRHLPPNTGSCSFGPSWGDRAHAKDAAHSYTECSGHGDCDRKSGQCSCYVGFTGTGCARSEFGTRVAYLCVRVWVRACIRVIHQDGVARG